MADVIHIGEWQLQRTQQRDDPGLEACDHKHIELDRRGAVVRCNKCGVQLSAFWALEMLSDEYNRALTGLAREKEALAKAKASETHLLAARKVERVWRSRRSLPACPHCGRGILPEDGLGSRTIARELELRRRAVTKEPR